MKKGWNKCKIGDLVSLEQGLCINSKTKHLLVKMGFPLLRITDLINNTQKQFINEEEVPKKVIADEEDLIYTRTGQVGLVFKGKHGVVHNNCFKVNPDEAKVKREFMYWFLKQESVLKYVNKVATGVAQLDLGHAAFKSIDFLYPIDLTEQQEIATTLSNYDDLIENNTKRIELLEKIAKLIYEEWFVKFKFPGHEKVKLVDSKLGKIPKGWGIKGLYDLAEIIFGFPFQSKLFSENINHNPIVRIRNIPKNETSTYSSEEVGDKYIIESGDFLIGMDGIFHMCMWANKKAYLNQRVAKINPLDKKSRFFLYWSVKPKIEILNEVIVGTTVQHLSQRDFQNMKLVAPNEDIINQFNENIEPILDQIINLKFKNQNLSKTRDLLLPRLITGKVDVSKLDIEVEA